MKTADKVRELYNKHNPDNLKLEFGCEVRFDPEGGYGWEGDFKEHRGIGIIKAVHPSGVKVELSPVGFYDIDEFFDWEIKEILGKHPTVLQVLGMLEGRIQVQNNGVVQRVVGNYYYSEKREVLFNIDPNIALFKDLPEETQDEIYKLIKINHEKTGDTNNTRRNRRCRGSIRERGN